MLRSRFPLVLVLALLSGLAVVTAPAASAQGACPDHQAPPPPVDTSERPPPGQAEPAPLPMPAEPVGGARMGECGMVFPAGAATPPETTAASWVVQDLDTGAVVAAKNPHARERPASLIKTLLALVVLKDLEQDQVIVPTEEDATQECTCVGIVAGGSYTVDQLLHGLLMHSGNDVAHAFATALGGVPATVQKMNDLAASLGATDTRAATPSGLDGPGMSTSAYDLSLIFHQAMRHPEFAAAVSTKSFQFPDEPGKPAFSIVNDNKLLGGYPGFLGGKTGFTDDARHTYVGGAERDGRRLAVVMMRAEQRPTMVVTQAAELLDYGFTLEKAGAQPVGRLVEPANPAEKAAGAPEQAAKAGATAKIPARDPFGLLGWMVTLAVALLIVTGFVIAYQRRRKTDSPS
ncbi:serine hydrolase [Amycolatopsis taiwanensis]|uniref:D-alanyl-D-alanine carboxypeptidase family protein n=1 Tax=Amycolatopsis taiwanensis TaxID=342230 RepID=UPI003D7FAC01